MRMAEVPFLYSDDTDAVRDPTDPQDRLRF